MSNESPDRVASDAANIPLTTHPSTSSGQAHSPPRRGVRLHRRRVPPLRRAPRRLRERRGVLLLVVLSVLVLFVLLAVTYVIVASKEHVTNEVVCEAGAIGRPAESSARFAHDDAAPRHDRLSFAVPLLELAGRHLRQCELAQHGGQCVASRRQLISFAGPISDNEYRWPILLHQHVARAAHQSTASRELLRRPGAHDAHRHLRRDEHPDPRLRLDGRIDRHAAQDRRGHRCWSQQIP